MAKKIKSILYDCPLGCEEGPRTEVPKLASMLFREGISFRVHAKAGRAMVLVTSKDFLKASQIHDTFMKMPADERSYPVTFANRMEYPLHEVLNITSGIVMEDTGMIVIIGDQSEAFMDYDAV